MIRKLTLKKEREHETNEASIAGNVMRDLIAHVTNDNLIGRKIKSGQRQHRGTAWRALPIYMTICKRIHPLRLII